MKNALIATIGAVLLAGVAWTLLTGAPSDPSLVQWNEFDETVVAQEDAQAPDTLGTDNGVARTAIAAEAQDVAASPTADREVPRVPVALRGRVVDSFQRPVAGAVVMLELRRENDRGAGFGRGRERQRVRKPVETARDGTFAFAGPGFPQMAVNLLITHREFAPGSFERTFTLAAGNLDGAGAATAVAKASPEDLDLGDLRVTSGGTIVGSVTDLDHNGIGNAVVRLLPQGGNRFAWGQQRDELFPERKAEANGWFSLVHVPAGQYRVHATAPGRLQETSDLITVSDGAEEQIEPLRLGPGATLTGAVYAPTGAPVADAEIAARGRRGEERTRSDTQGAFTIDHLSTGSLAVRVTAKGFLTWSQAEVDPAKAPLVVHLAEGLRLRGIVRDAVTGEVVTRYAAKAHRIGGVPDPQRDAQVQQARAEMQRVRDLMRSANSGTDVDREAARQQIAMLRDQMEAAGRTLQRFEVQRGPSDFRGGREGPRGGRGGDWGASRGDRGERGEQGGRGPGRGNFGARLQNLPRDTGDVVDRPNGTFSFGGLDEGVYVVDVAAPDHQKVRSEPIELRAGSMTPELSILLPRGLSVSGKVISSPANLPVPGAQVDLLLLAEDDGPSGGAAAGPGNDGRNAMRAFLAEARRNGGPRGVPVVTERTDAAGEFTLRNAPPGRYAIAAQAPGHSRRTGEPFELSQDQGEVQLVLGALATLQGRVTGIPRGREQEARVIAFAGMGNMETRDVQPDGTYRIDDLQPGSYMVRAFVGDVRGFIGRQMAQVMRGGEAPRMDIELGDGEVETLNLGVILQPAGEVSGTVTKNGVPARGLRVDLSPKSSDGEPGAGIAFQGRGGPLRGGPGGDRGRRFAGGGTSTVTDQRGQFVLQEVPEGTYALRVRTDGRGRTELYEQEVYVREDAKVELTIAVSTGSLEGRVVAPANDAGAASAPGLDGNLRLLPGVSKIPDDLGAFSREHPVQQVQVRGGAFRADELPSGPYLLVLNLRGREPVTKQVYVPVGGSERLELQAGPPRQQQPGQGNQGPGPQGQAGQGPGSRGPGARVDGNGGQGAPQGGSGRAGNRGARGQGNGPGNRGNGTGR